LRKRIISTFVTVATLATMSTPLAHIARAETAPAPNPRLQATVQSQLASQSPKVVRVPAPNAQLQTVVPIQPADPSPKVIRVPAPNAQLQTLLVIHPAVQQAGQPAGEPVVQQASQPVIQQASDTTNTNGNSNQNQRPAVTANQVDAASVSSKLRQQAQDKAGEHGLLNAMGTSTARAGDTIDTNQASVKSLTDSGQIKVQSDTQGAYAYVQPYMEPNDFAHRNYCGAGATVSLLGHFDPSLPQNVNIDQIGQEINLDPNAGAWVKDIVPAVNSHLNQIAGQDVNWYQYGQAQSLNDLRWMINVDIQQNGVPFITSLNTGGLPGWGSTDVGHIVAVYGYTRMPDGTEYVHYEDTAPPSSGFTGHTFNTVELGQFWQAVSGNSAQVW